MESHGSIEHKPRNQEKSRTTVSSTMSGGFNGALRTVCVGCDIVQADHAPDGGVAQGIFHGVLVRHHGRNQEEVEEELEQEVKGQEVDAQTTTCTCMDGMR